jgi:hypothetical protein
MMDIKSGTGRLKPVPLSVFFHLLTGADRQIGDCYLIKAAPADRSLFSYTFSG